MSKPQFAKRPVEIPPPESSNEQLRTCTLNGKMYLVPDRSMKGSELRTLLVALAGSIALEGELYVVVRNLDDGGRTLAHVTPDVIVGETFGGMTTLQVAPPLTLFTITSKA